MSSGSTRKRNSTPARPTPPPPVKLSPTNRHNQHNKPMSCCERIQNKIVHQYYVMTSQEHVWKDQKRTRKKQARQRLRNKQILREAPVISRRLAYTRPFLRGESTPKKLQVDRPIAAGDIPILFQSDRLVVVHKPAPIPSQKNADYARAHMRAVLKRQLNLSGRFAPLHRLDVCTTGVMLWSPSKQAAACFTQKIRDREVQKIYLSLVRGQFPTQAVCTEQVDNKDSMTHFYRLELDQATRKANAAMLRASKRSSSSGSTSGSSAAAVPDDVVSLVCCVPRTGRKHQIRKHLKSLGFPIANDPRYGGYAGLQYRNRDVGLGMYRDPKVVQMFREAWATYEGMENVDGLKELQQHIDCCDRAAAAAGATGSDGEEGEQEGSPWTMTWLAPIFLHAWMYYGQGGLASEEDAAPWCFRAPRPAWATGLNLDQLPTDVRARFIRDSDDTS